MTISADMLTYTAVISTKTVTSNALGQEVNSFSVLHAAAPCRIKRETREAIKDSGGNEENWQNKFRMVVNIEFGDAVRGDRVVTEGRTYSITAAYDVRDSSGIDHSTYILEEISV